MTQAIVPPQPKKFTAGGLVLVIVFVIVISLAILPLVRMDWSSKDPCDANSPLYDPSVCPGYNPVTPVTNIVILLLITGTILFIVGFVIQWNARMEDENDGS